MVKDQLAALGKIMFLPEKADESGDSGELRIKLCLV